MTPTSSGVVCVGIAVTRLATAFESEMVNERGFSFHLMSLAANPLNPVLRRNPAALPPTLPTGQQSAAESAIAFLEQSDPADVSEGAKLEMPLPPVLPV